MNLRIGVPIAAIIVAVMASSAVINGKATRVLKLATTAIETIETPVQMIVGSLVVATVSSVLT